MAVESKLVGEKEREYPYLWRHFDGEVVLFYADGAGTFLLGVNATVGYATKGLIEADFTPLLPFESVTIRNV